MAKISLIIESGPIFDFWLKIANIKQIYHPLLYKERAIIGKYTLNKAKNVSINYEPMTVD